MNATDTPTAKDAAIVVRSRLGLEPAEIRRFLTGLCHHVFSVTTSDRQLSKQQRLTVEAYTLLFCVDFMSELGQRFNKEGQPEIDLGKFARLKSVFETLAE